MLLRRADLGRAVKRETGPGDTNSFEIHNEEGKIMGGEGRRTSQLFHCSALCRVWS